MVTSQSKSAGHTPAPWTLKHLNVNHAMIHGSDGMSIVPKMISEPGTASEANASLIAAAPDLFSALADLTAALIAGYPVADIAVQRAIREAQTALGKAVL